MSPRALAARRSRVPTALGPILRATLLVGAGEDRALLLDPGDCRDVLAAGGRHLPGALRERLSAGADGTPGARLSAAGCRQVLEALAGGTP